MTPEQARAYNRAIRDILTHIEHRYGAYKGTQTGAVIDCLGAEIYTMQKKTAYKVTEYSPYHAKQEAVEID